MDERAADYPGIDAMVATSPLAAGDFEKALEEDLCDADDKIEDELRKAKLTWAASQAKKRENKAKLAADLAPPEPVVHPGAENAIPFVAGGMQQSMAKTYLPPDAQISKQKEWHQRWRVKATYMTERSYVFDRFDDVADHKALKEVLSWVWAEYVALTGHACPWSFA